MHLVIHSFIILSSCIHSSHLFKSLQLRRTQRDLFPQSPPHHTYFNAYFSPTPLLTAGRSAILSIHFSRWGNGSISSFVNPVRSHPLTQGQVPISATLYLPLPLPARYSRGDPVYLPERWISRTPKTRRVSLRKRSMASSAEPC